MFRLKSMFTRVAAVVSFLIPVYCFSVPVSDLEEASGVKKTPYKEAFSYGPKMYGYRILKLLDFSKELNLSSEQQDKIFNTIIQMKQKNDALSTEIIKVKYEVLKELSKTQPDFGKVKSLNSQIVKLESEVKLNFKNSFIDVLSVLTPEQRSKLESLGHFRFQRRSADKGTHRGNF